MALRQAAPLLLLAAIGAPSSASVSEPAPDSSRYPESAIEDQAKIDTLLQLQQLAQRSARVRWEIARRDPQKCKERKFSIGLTVHSAELYAAGLANAAKAAFGLQPDYPAIWTIAPGGPADRAGLRPGDTFFAINGESMVASDQTQQSAGQPTLARAVRSLDALPDLAPARIEVIRSGILMNFSVLPQQVCAADVDASAAQEIALLTKSPQLLAKLELTRDDDEFAKLMFKSPKPAAPPAILPPSEVRPNAEPLAAGTATVNRKIRPTKRTRSR